jgi:lamin tail-like protein
MFSKLVASASLVGLTAALAVAGPASAATAPTLTVPASRVGFGQITLSGTAAPGAAVQLYEGAFVFTDPAQHGADLAAADDWENGGGPLTATADSAGHWSLLRFLDSGFYFQVESQGLRSPEKTVSIQEGPTLTVSSPSSNAVRAHVLADPAQPGLPVQVQLAGAGGAWSTVASGVVSEAGTLDATIAQVPAGARSFRAYIGADPSNAVLAGYSATQAVTVGGTATAPAPTTPAPTTPAPTTPAPAAPKPTAPKPTTPTAPTAPKPTAPAVPPVPAAGSVQFTKIQYNSPGTDTGRTTSLNGEWFRLTNKTAKAMDLKGWTVRDVANHRYTFTSSFRLGAGASVYVHTGRGTATSTNRYWGSKRYIWNNDGDTATVRTAAGKTIDTCKWGKGSGVTSC